MPELKSLLEESAARHSHLCPRQVLGVRMGLVGASLLGIDAPDSRKRMLVIIESDGCFADGIEVATGCTVGHRTLRVEDYGKVAGTFIHINSTRAIRLAPHRDARKRAWAYTPNEQRRYYAQLHAYQVMPVEALLSVREVCLVQPVEELLSRPGIRTRCERCGEEIINQREVKRNGKVFCRSCSGDSYYRGLGIALPEIGWKEFQLSVIHS